MHSFQERMSSLKSSRPRAPPRSLETLFLSLSHYSSKDNLSSCSSDTKSAEEDEDYQDSISDETDVSLKHSFLNPFVDLDASSINAQANKILDYASDSDSDAESAFADPSWFNDNILVSSGAESLENFEDEPLRHAGVYTEEEIIEITREKMINLQTLYVEQLKRLQYVFREKRREYLLELKKEKEILSNIHSQPRSTVKEEQIYQKLKALNRYQRHSGIEAILRKKSIERRVKAANGVQLRGSHGSKCVFTEGGVKCAVKVLPLSKFCRKHILKDPNQVLFKVCGLTKADIPCQEPIAVLFEGSTCIFHMRLPTLPHLNMDNSPVKKADRFKDTSNLPNTRNTKSDGKATSLPKTQLQRVLEGEAYFSLTAHSAPKVVKSAPMTVPSGFDSKPTLKSILERPSLHQNPSSRSTLSTLLQSQPEKLSALKNDHDYGFKAVE